MTTSLKLLSTDFDGTLQSDYELPAVPETILKRRKRQAENRALRAKEAVKSKVKLLKNGKLQNIS